MLMFTCFLQMLRKSDTKLVYVTLWVLMIFKCFLFRRFLSLKAEYRFWSLFIQVQAPELLQTKLLLSPILARKNSQLFMLSHWSVGSPLNEHFEIYVDLIHESPNSLRVKFSFAITIKHQIFGKAVYWGWGPTCVCKRGWDLWALDSSRQNMMIGV